MAQKSSFVLIDKQNNVFGKFPLGYIVLAFAAFFGLVVFFQIVLLPSDQVVIRIKAGPGNWWWVTPRPPDWLATSIKSGDKEYNAIGQPTAEVLRVQIYDAGGTTRDVYATIKISAKKNRRTNKYRYKGEYIEIGGPVAVTLNKTLFQGLVTKIYEPNESIVPPLVKKIVRVKYPDRWPHEFDAVVVGDSMTDGDGTKISTIIAKEQSPSVREGIDSSGRLTYTTSPIKNDFYITMELLVEQRGEEFIFREEQYVKINNGLWIQYPHYNITGAEILSIQDP